MGPTNPIETAPTVQLSHMGGDPATENLCAGLSPCDAFDYDRDGSGGPDGLIGAPGMCFLPPTVDNHLSDPACSADPVAGLDGVFQLAWCHLDYSAYPDGSGPPSIGTRGCQPEADWKDLVEDGAFYQQGH